MDRRDFLKMVGLGTMTLFLSGCGLSVLAKEGSSAAEKVSGGKKMKIVVINSSPHTEKESTSRYLSQKFVEGAKSVGHEVFVFDAANEETNPCRGCGACGMDGPCIFNDAIETKLMPKMLEADLLCLVTPLYYYGMSAQLKMIIDRFYARTEKLHRKKSVMMATAWNSADWTFTALQKHWYATWNGKMSGRFGQSVADIARQWKIRSLETRRIKSAQVCKQ